VLALESKLRRRDLLAPALARAAFYAGRVPAAICDRRAFEAWRRAAEERDPRLLCMRREDALGSDLPPIDPADYPDGIELAGNALGLRYRFAPGDARDGVTLTVPAALLGELGQGMLDHLVPGQLREKVEALLWTLPKSLRRALPALQPLARELAPGLRGCGRPLAQALADLLRERWRVALPEDALREPALPPHLRPLLRVIGADGRLLAAGRDLGALQAGLAPQSGRVVHEPRWERSGLVRFDFDELPEEVLVREGGVRLRVYTALEDHGSSVALRLLRSRDAAARTTRVGLARLFALALPQQAAWIRDGLAKDRALVLLAQGVGTPLELGDQLALAVFAQVFEPPGAAPVRTRAEFDARLQAGRARIVEASEGPAAALRRALELRRSLLARLQGAPAAWSTAVADLREQLGALIHPGFLRATPVGRLAELPRYLQAMALRLDKLAGGPARDAALAARVRPHWERYRALPADLRAAAEPASELGRLRWMIEELRVSLFAQTLGARERVSPQRLEKQWQRVRAELRE
jgi:ATP-dependent helicase HrpA